MEKEIEKFLKGPYGCYALGGLFFMLSGGAFMGVIFTLLGLTGSLISYAKKKGWDK